MLTACPRPQAITFVTFDCEDLRDAISNMRYYMEFRLCKSV